MKLVFPLSDEVIATSVSAVVRVGGDVWVGADEGTSVLIFRPEAGDGSIFQGVDGLDLVTAFDLPGKPDKGKFPEVDLEGMDWETDRSYLWVVGSHSLKRKAAKVDKDTVDNLKRLRDISADGNRFLLGRLAVRVEDGASAALPRQEQDEHHFTARIGCTDHSSTLLDALAKDPLLGPFVSTKIPGKDNGLDIEGLVWIGPGNRLLVGLRGPVLRGMAVILELELEERFESNAETGTLKLLPIGPDNALYKRHFLDLDGLGIRDLCLHGSDLLILAGPTHPIDWPVSIYRWKDVRTAVTSGECFAWREEDQTGGGLTLACHQPLTPTVRKHDRPEALLLSPDGTFHVFCDSPSDHLFTDHILSSISVKI